MPEMRLPLFLSLILLGGSCRPPTPPPAPRLIQPVSASGLGVEDLVIGSGPMPKPGQTCTVEALGWVEEHGAKGHLFLDTRKQGYPTVFPFGVGRVIKGWEEGLATMKQGGKRRLRVPPSLGYTAREAGEDIPAGATLIFEIDLIGVR